MSEQPSRAFASKILHNKRFERSPSLDSYHMTSQEERQIRNVMSDPQIHNNEIHRSAESEFSSDSVVRVHIEDFCDLSGSESRINLTSHSLRKCKTHILVPYSRLLKLIGWRKFGKDIYGSGSGCGWKALNGFYLVIIILLMLYSYIYDIMSCQWKLDLKYDIKLPTTTTNFPLITLRPSSNHSADGNTTHHHIRILLINGTAIDVDLPNPSPADSSSSNETTTCGHIVTTYIIPDLLHLAAYILGLWYFRIRENEQLYALMEKVFLETANVQTKAMSQTKLITKLRSFFLLGAVWVLFSLCLQGLFVYTFGMERDNLLSTLRRQEPASSFVWLWILFGIDLLGVSVTNCINLAVVLNYSIQCEVLRYYVNTVGTRLTERSTDLKSAMQDVLGIRESISLLNSSVAQMTSLAVIRFAEMFVIGLCILILNEDDHWKVWLYRSLFPIVWAVILIFPLIQAASMNAACSKFKAIALNIRVFGYQNLEDHELDSFLTFIANTTLRSRLFHIPVKPSYLLGATIVTCFTLLLLFQTSSVSSSGRLF